MFRRFYMQSRTVNFSIYFDANLIKGATTKVHSSFCQIKQFYFRHWPVYQESLLFKIFIYVSDILSILSPKRQGPCRSFSFIDKLL